MKFNRFVALLMCFLMIFSSLMFTVNAEEDNSISDTVKLELEQAFLEYCLSDNTTNSDATVTIHKTLQFDGLTYFVATADWRFPSALDHGKEIGGYYFHSGGIFDPYELALYVYDGEKIYEFETAYNNGMVTDIEAVALWHSPEYNQAKEYIATAEIDNKNFVYNGKVQKPIVTVRDSEDNILTENTDYTLEFSEDSKNVGKYSVVVKYTGNYSGESSFKYNIIPKGTTLKNVTGNKKALKIQWKKQKNETTGYRVQYSRNSAFKNSVVKKIKNNDKNSIKIKGLSGNKKYFVRIRTYKVVNGKTYYSKWSKALSVKTK